jgi:hemerythrin-like domain-containing protein
MTPNTNPIQYLMDEHQLILEFLGLFEARLVSLGAEPCPAAFVTDCVDFFSQFADTCHHGKEEALLFPLLEQRGIPRDGGPIGCMVNEHHFGRACLGRIRQSLPAAAAGGLAAAAAIREAGLAYAAMLRQHIDKEDHILFQMALRVLDESDLAALRASFATVPDTRVHFQALAARLSLCAAASQP